MNLEGLSYNLQQTESKSAHEKRRNSPSKVALRHYCGRMMSCDIIRVPAVTGHLSQFSFVFDCGSTSVRHKKYHSLNYHTEVERGQYFFIYSSSVDITDVCRYQHPSPVN